jgi:hypothetical protein
LDRPVGAEKAGVMFLTSVADRQENDSHEKG